MPSDGQRLRGRAPSRAYVRSKTAAAVLFADLVLASHCRACHMLGLVALHTEALTDSSLVKRCPFQPPVLSFAFAAAHPLATQPSPRHPAVFKPPVPSL